MNVTEFDLVQKYIEDLGTVYPVIDGRITLIQSNAAPTNQSNDSSINEIPANHSSGTTQQASQPGSASQFTVSMSVLFVTVVMLFNCIQ